MAMLVIKPGFKVYSVPECECGDRMIPKDLRNIGKDWKCPNCEKEKKKKNDRGV
jgi:predicted RNA-binding Zn-ribbon protein involved in translation (DUF1610 family)